jgi:serine/threonine protein kinase
MVSSNDESSNNERDLEAADEESNATGSSAGKLAASEGRVSGGRSGSNPFSLGFLAKDFGGRQPTWKKYLPWSRASDFHQQRFKEAIFGLSSAGSTSMTKSWHARFCPWFSPQVRKEEEFMSEMRVLARLRHPCITTVMGAVISRSHDPMLVMEYMEYGSLHDLLSNETMLLSG